MNPKAYLITASDSIDSLIQTKDTNCLKKINKFSVIINAITGYYLIGALASDVEKEFCVVPIFDSVIGHFDEETRNWFQTLGVIIYQTRAVN